MNIMEFRDTVVVPTLRKMEMDSRAAEKLLLMTANHESGRFKHKKQLNGPALSYFQIEPETLADLYKNYLSHRPEKKELLDQFLPDGMTPEEALLMSDEYACAAARMIYYRVPQRLPNHTDNNGLGVYWKTFYNTPLGKGTIGKFLGDWITHLEETMN